MEPSSESSDAPIAAPTQRWPSFMRVSAAVALSLYSLFPMALGVQSCLGAIAGASLHPGPTTVFAILLATIVSTLELARRLILREPLRLSLWAALASHLMFALIFVEAGFRDGTRD